MKSGDCLLWRSSSPLGWLIRLFSKEFNHASIVLSLSAYENLSDRRWQLEALEHGTVLTLISKRLEGYKGEVWWYPVKTIFDRDRAMVESWALEHVGIGYDYHSLFRQVFVKVSANAKRLFCSEYFYLAWRHATGFDFGMETAPRPGDIPSMRIFDKPVKIAG